VAERAWDLELCLRIVRALLARKQVEIAPARVMVESAMESRHGQRAVRMALAIAAHSLDAGDELSRVALRAASRAAKALAREWLVYRSALRRRGERTPLERTHLKWCVDNARAVLDRLAMEPTEATDRMSGVWVTDGATWRNEHPGVHRVQPRERLESGVRFTVARASGDDDA
jgi:hypothetical protein